MQYSRASVRSHRDAADVLRMLAFAEHDEHYTRQNIPRRHAPEDLQSSIRPQKIRGRRESRVPSAPAIVRKNAHG